MDPQPPTRGLPAIREERQRRKGWPKIPPRFWLWVFTILAVWAIIYWKVQQGRLESWRSRVLAKQRAVASELGPRYEPLKHKLEGWITAAAADFPGDLVEPEARTSPFRTKPGVYLRLFIDDAKDPKDIRRASLDSLRDGFTSCLTRANNPDPWSGKPCQHNHECEQGQHCNETNHCSVPAQPYNLRVAYRATRILTEDWVKEVREGNDMALRLHERDFESAVQDDIPLVIDLMARAQYFLLVLDEPADHPEQLPEAGTRAESIQAVAHPTRVFIYDIPQNKLLLRVRDTVVAQVGAPTTDPKTLLAVRRQANNCAMAVRVRKMLGEDEAAP